MIRTQCHRFDCLEAFNHAARGTGLDLEFEQLVPGPAQIEVRAILRQHLTINRYDLTVPAIRRGANRPDVHTFWLRDHSECSDGYWCGRPYDSPGVALFADEFYASGSRPLTGTTIEVPHATIALVSANEHELTGPRSVALGDVEMRRLTRLLTLVSAGAGAGAELELVTALLEAVAAPEITPTRPRLATRLRTFRLARDYIEAHPDVSSVAHLSRAAGTSRRTLEYAFQQFAGCTPKGYLTAVRLNRARRELRASDPSGRVIDVANRWGFWHMGQFAADYRAWFGVPPSADLGRAPREQPPG